MVLNRHGRKLPTPKASMPCCLHIPPGIQLYLNTWLYSTIANIANYGQLSTYFAGDRKSPASTGLSMAKQHSILDLHGIHGIIKVDKEGIYASIGFKRFLYLMHQTSKDTS
jgi:hypothetical protein